MPLLAGDPGADGSGRRGALAYRCCWGQGSGDLLDIDVIGPHICQGLHFSPLFSHLHESVDAVLALKGFVKTPAPAPHLLYACHRRHPGAEKRQSIRREWPSREGLQLRMQSMARSSADTYVPAKILMEVGRSKAENGGYIR